VGGIGRWVSVDRRKPTVCLLSETLGLGYGLTCGNSPGTALSVLDAMRSHANGTTGEGGWTLTFTRQGGWGARSVGGRGDRDCGWYSRRYLTGLDIYLVL